MRGLRLIPRSIWPGVLMMPALIVTGCMFGPKVEKYTPASSGRGLMMLVELTPEANSLGFTSFVGELLEVRPNGVVLLTSERLVFVSFADIRSAKSDEDSRVSVGRSGPSNATSERLRLQSRFPQGLSDEVLAELLSIHGQETVEIVTRE